MDKDEIRKLVESGYDKAAINHQHQIDLTRAELAIYTEFKGLIQESVLELGSGDGRPIAQDLLQSGINYIGIDLSSKQVELARKNNPGFEDRFK